MITKTRKGINEAELLDLHLDMMELIGIRFEEFTDDILPMIFDDPKQFCIRYSTKDDVLKIEWDWPSREISRIHEMRYSPTTESERMFVDRIAAWLYGMLVFIVNFG